ncbi:serine hydrolase domain-containing protein [Streptomyces sp. NPDC093149]|uniref:serine hydrolase domain-containing protein n=1 Tax=Streptomyces sp. NPDC093149 TaxID=3366031 RepID=UPI0038246C7F
MSELNELCGWLESRLPELLAEYKVPAASIAVYAHGEVIDRAAGVLNKDTGVEATADSVFQIGSITKVWTTTLAMQLVDEGALDIDAPVRSAGLGIGVTSGCGSHRRASRCKRSSHPGARRWRSQGSMRSRSATM